MLIGSPHTHKAFQQFIVTDTNFSCGVEFISNQKVIDQLHNYHATVGSVVTAVKYMIQSCRDHWFFSLISLNSLFRTWVIGAVRRASCTVKGGFLFGLCLKWVVYSAAVVSSYNSVMATTYLVKWLLGTSVQDWSTGIIKETFCYKPR